jgi:hypothetical protein
MSMLLHDCSLRSKGRRMYSQILKVLALKENINMIKGIGAYNFTVMVGKS